MSEIQKDVEKRLLMLVRRMAPEQVQEVLTFAERLMGGEQDRDRARAALRASFGIWRDREDLRGDSTDIVRAMREEWEEREKRLGLA